MTLRLGNSDIKANFGVRARGNISEGEINDWGDREIKRSAIIHVLDDSLRFNFG